MKGASNTAAMPCDEFAVLASIPIFSGRVFSVRTDEVRGPDGRTMKLDIVGHRGSYGIIATADAGIVLVRQYRHPLRRMLWEIPAGTAERDEEMVSGALRELAEETGFHARRIRPLGWLAMTPGFCDEVLHFFWADDLQAGTQSLDEDEAIEVGVFSRKDARRLLHAGEIIDAKTVLALQWLERGRYDEPIGVQAPS
ncbi:MAG: NUDIX hydrolase [Bacillati bacterium]